MHTLSLKTAQDLVKSCRDDLNPTAQAQAWEARDRYLLAIDLGELVPEPGAREALDAA